MKPFVAALAAEARRIGTCMSGVAFQQVSHFALLLATVAWSYEMLNFVPVPLPDSALPLSEATLHVEANNAPWPPPLSLSDALWPDAGDASPALPGIPR